MERLLRYLAGYVLISVRGEQAERFLNLCRSRGIALTKICRGEDQCLNAVLSVKDFFLLRPLRSKTKVHIRILEKHGLPFFFFRSKKRKAFFVGILLCLCLLGFLSTRIWNIHVEGNRKHSTQEILEFLEQEGVVHGMARSRVNCSGIAASIRKKYPEITWVSARIEGTRLLLTIQEGILMEEKEEEEEKPCSIIADKEGTIVKMVTRRGVPQVKPGDVCKKGDLLVLGRLDIRDDSQEVVRSEYVHADADIYIAYDLPYYRSFSLKHVNKVPTGEERRGIYLKAGSWYLELEGDVSSGWERTAEEYPLRITENFVLPASLGIVTLKQYREEQAAYTQEEARKLAFSRLQRYEEKLMEKGLQISTNNVTIETDDMTCTSSGSLRVTERIGREALTEGQKEPTERTSDDGE